MLAGDECDRVVAASEVGVRMWHLAAAKGGPVPHRDLTHEGAGARG